MDNINEDFEKYYRFTTHQIQQQQQQQQQQLQHHHHQLTQHQQQLNQQQIQQQHHQNIHNNFDQQDVLSLVSNDYYSTSNPSVGHFATNNPSLSFSSSTSHVLMNSQYKHQTDDPKLFMEQISRSAIPQQINTNTFTPSNIPTSQQQPFPPNDNLIVEQLQQQQRRNSDILFNNDNNNINSNNNLNNNNHSNHNNNYIFSQQPQQQQQQQQQHVMINDGNAMLSTFEQPQTPLTSNVTHSNFTPKPRREQDLFCELISMATKNNARQQQQPDMSSWQSHANANAIQYIPPSFANSPTELFPPSIQRQIQKQHQQQMLQQQQHKNQNYYIPTTSATSSNIAQVAAATALANSSNNITPTKGITPSPVIEDDGSINTSNDNERIYELRMAQQPSRARMCGFGDKDRRPISPPPIVQLIVTTKYGQIINPETFDASFLVVMCDSWQQNNEPEDGEIKLDNPLSQVVSFPTTTTDDDGVETNIAIKMRNLVGSSVSSAAKLYDLNGNLGIFFVFQDVSLRTEGCFRLKFSLVDVGSPYSHNVNTTSVSHVLKAIHTDPFMVYTAKKFPGVVQSTPLSKCFARQGIKISIRKEKSISSASAKKRQTNNHRNHNNPSAEMSDDEDEHDDEI